jgi:hypothetical protein
LTPASRAQKLILDMHAPHGGFQGPGYSGNFWSSSDKKARTKALWTEIASRYQDETVVAAYDLFNEPAPPTHTQLVAYTQELVDVVRAVDGNHLLIVEMDYGDEEGTPFLVADSATNTMYDFHQYYPWRYSAALGYHYGYGDYGVGYPDADAYLQPYDNDKVDEGLAENVSIALGDSAWTWYEGRLMTPPNANTWGALPVLISDGNGGTVYFDDFVVDEYDSAGGFLRRIQHLDPDPKPSDWWLLYETHIDRDPFVSYTNDWASAKLGAGVGGSGNRGTSTTAHLGTRSLTVSNSSGKYSITNQKLKFVVKQGHQYRISGWVKGSGANLALRWYGFKSWDTPKPFTKASLEQGFFDNDSLQFFIDANVPVNIGEFGTAVANFSNGRGGLNWVRDMLDIMGQYAINAQYFHYHISPWGIYYNVFGFPKADHYNQPLADPFAGRGYRGAPTPQALFPLSVINGSGGGDYAAGSQVQINADAAPAGEVFGPWSSFRPTAYHPPPKEAECNSAFPGSPSCTRPRPGPNDDQGPPTSLTTR